MTHHTDKSPPQSGAEKNRDVLIRLVEDLSLETDFDRACTVAVAAAMRVLKADYGALALPDSAKRLRYTHILGFPREVNGNHLPEITPGTLAAFEHDSNVFVTDYVSYAGAKQFFLDLQVRSGFAAPVRVDKAAVGVLTLAWRHRVDALEQQDIDLVEVVLRQVGAGLHRHLLAQQLAKSEARSRGINQRLLRVMGVSPVVNYSVSFNPARGENSLVLNFVSDNFFEWFGYPRDFLSTDMTRRWYGLVHPDDIDSMRLANRPEAIAKGLDERIYRLRHAAGHYLWVQDNLRIFPGAAEGELEVVGAILDITERKRAENAHQEADMKYRFLVEQSLAAVYMCQDGRYKYVNPKFSEIFGYSEAEILAAPSMLDFIHEEDRALVQENFRNRLEGKSRDSHYRFRVRHKNGKIVHAEAHGAIAQIDGKPTIIGMGIDITEQVLAEQELKRHRDQLQELVREQTAHLLAAKQTAETAMEEARRAEAQIRMMAYHDALTGLPNRALLLDRLKQAMLRADRGGKKLAMMFIDLDRFKQINDTLGHSVGDKLLQSVAGRLVDCVRHTDTVCRLGGDEFVILLGEVDVQRSVTDIAEKLLATVAAPHDVDGRELMTTHSIGISLYPDHSRDADELMSHADIALYKAKDAGRNTYCFFTPKMVEEAIERLELGHRLHRAVEQGEFVLYYQPKIALVAGSGTGKIIGVEALVRWRHPDLGLLLPEKFLRIAEDNGLIVPLGNWVLRTACQQNRAWEKAGLPIVPMAVNLSAVQLRRGDFPGNVANILEEEGMEPRYLEFELTESTIMHNADESIRLMNTLSRMGIRLVVDDFGTGYSSLEYLKRLPVSALKIDQTFVRDITVDADDAAIARAIIGMAHSMQLKVVAEGVETGGQLDFLLAEQCDEGQGIYFCEPLAAEEMAELLVQRRVIYPGKRNITT